MTLCQRGIFCNCVSVRPSVCLSVRPSVRHKSVLYRELRKQRRAVSEVDYSWRFSTNISLYLRNSARYGHSYYGSLKELPLLNEVIF